MIDLKFNIIPNNKCGYFIEDNTEVGGSGYISESSNVIVKGRFKKSQTKLFSAIIQHDYDKPEYSISHGNEIQSNRDGWTDVISFVLPTKEWYDSVSNSVKKLYDVIYYYSNENIYKVIDNKVSLSTIYELIKQEPEGTTISKTDDVFFSICFLKNCFISLCKEIFETQAITSCFGSSNDVKQLQLRRDLVFMTIKVIEYLVEDNQLAEAQRILKNIGGCNGVCKEYYKQSKSNGCGCS